MDISLEGESPQRNVTGLAIAISAHLVLGYALVSGLAHRVVDALVAPLDVTVLQAPKPLVVPPPPTPPKAAQPHPLQAPPPLYVPPPEMVSRAPVQETVTAVTSTPVAPVAALAAPIDAAPPAPPVLRTAPVDAPPVPPAVVAVPVVALGAACPNHLTVRTKVDYPAQAQLRGLSGDVLVELTVNASGAVGDVHVLRSTNAVFDDTAVTAVARHLQCVAQGQNVRVRIPFNFRLST